MKAKNLFLLSFIILTACSSNEPKSNSSHSNDLKYNLLFKGSSPYIDWYSSDTESFVSFSFRDYPNDKTERYYEQVRGVEDNTITLKNDIKICLHDDYQLKEDKQTTTLQLTRNIKILQDKTEQNSPYKLPAMQKDDPFDMSQTYSFTIQSATPINFIRPLIDDCNPIPMCFYDNFEIEWNGDLTNENGVVIIAEWNGCSMYDAPVSTSLANVDLVEDTGSTILNTDLFEGIPDEALVNIWFIRGNLITINGEGNDVLSLNEVLENSPENFEASLAENPGLLLQLQPFMFGSGAVAGFSFYLIREL